MWVIYNGTTVAGLLSTSASAPTLPSGYTYKARVGWVRTDGSSNLWRTIQYDNRAQWVSPAAGYQVMASGSSSAAWLAVATGAYAPTSSSAIIVGAQKGNVNGTYGVHPNNAISLPTGSVSTSMLWSGTNASTGLPMTMQATMMLETTNIYWFSDNATTYLYAQGWIDNL